jgi:hypothetical protein
MTLLLHQLLHATTPVTLSDMLMPQVPAIACAIGLLAFLAAVDVAVDLPARAVWLRLLVTGSVSTSFYLLFVWFVPVRAVQELRADVLEHASPVLRRLATVRRPSSTVEPPVNQ